MLMKLALRNVRRSVRDYAVYFVTLTLGVAVFYAMGMRFLWQAWLAMGISGGLWALIAHARWKREQNRWVRKMGWEQDDQ